MQVISEATLEETLEENEKSIVPNDKPDYKDVARIAKRILNANKDIQEIFEKNWTVFLGKYLCPIASLNRLDLHPKF